MTKTKRKLPKILLMIAIVVVVLIGMIVIMFSSMKPEKLEVSNVDLAAIGDGVYTGSADNGMVSATVSVKVNGGVIQDITILEHETLLGKPAEKITGIIIEQQTLDVDAISSATYSSDVIRKAVENALRQGE